tara:strand:- start:345 stop:551 length:207 start_codon:yes stop_codon:yes gene_type:complete
VKKSVKLYPTASESVLEDFFVAAHAGSFTKLHIPQSDVFYVRAAIEADTGVRYTLAHVEGALKLEGMI